MSMYKIKKKIEKKTKCVKYEILRQIDTCRCDLRLCCERQWITSIYHWLEHQYRLYKNFKQIHNKFKFKILCNKKLPPKILVQCKTTGVFS